MNYISNIEMFTVFIVRSRGIIRDKKMIDGFKEDIEPDIMIRGMQKDKRETLKPFFDEEKKEK